MIKDNSNKSLEEIQSALLGQTILSPEQAKEWGIVQEIKPVFTVEPGAVFVAVSNPAEKPEKPKPSENPFTSIVKP